MENSRSDSWARKTGGMSPFNLIITDLLSKVKNTGFAYIRSYVLDQYDTFRIRAIRIPRVGYLGPRLDQKILDTVVEDAYYKTFDF